MKSELTVGDILVYLAALQKRLWRLFRVLWLFLILFVVIGLALYSSLKPSYTAVATIGPPNPSPVSSMLSQMGSPTSSGVRRLFGGGGSGSGNDPFQQYSEVLKSPQLAIALADKDNFLRVIFTAMWDSAAQRWRRPGMLHGIASVVKRKLHLAVADAPDVNLLMNYLNSHLSVAPASTGSDSALTRVAGSGSSYLKVAFVSDDPRRAEQLLQVVLNRADSVIRRQQMEDIEARISYLTGELAQTTQAEQRAALIQIFANQEETKTMIVADKRFSYVLISEPYASPNPTSPMPPVKFVGLLVFLSLAVWFGIAIAIPYFPRLHGLLRQMKLMKE